MPSALPRLPDRAVRNHAEDRAAPGTGAVALGLAALLAAGTALQVNADARRAERENPPLGRFVAVRGVRLHHLDLGTSGGDGPPVVLLHGNGSMVEDFLTSGLVELLAPRHRVVLVDRPGFGHSERPRERAWTPEAQAALFAAAFARLGLERPVVLGHSWGTLVALALALDHPERVGGLVLASGYYVPTARIDAALLAPPAVPVVGDALRYTVAPPLGRLLAPRVFARLFAPMPVPPRFAAGFPVAMALRPWQIRALAEENALLVPAAERFERRYRELAGRGLPIAILAGAEDRIVDPVAHSARLHESLAGSVLRVAPGQGHMIHHGDPGLVAAAVGHVARRAVEGVAARRLEPA